MQDNRSKICLQLRKIRSVLAKREVHSEVTTRATSLPFTARSNKRGKLVAETFRFQNLNIHSNLDHRFFDNSSGANGTRPSVFTTVGLFGIR